MKKGFFSRLEFWQQLVIFFSTGMAVLALCTSVVLTITANNSLKSQLIGQALYLTESLARQARLSLLYESPEEAGDIVDIALQYPDVVGVSIRTDKDQVLRQQGNLPLPDSLKRYPADTILAEDLENHLVFVAPVRTQVETDFVLHEETADPSGEVLGYITLVISKGSLAQIWVQLLESNLVVSIIVAIPLLLLLLVLTRRLTDPLRSLSRVMHKAESGELNLRATLEGPKDLGDMQKAFNTMMASLEKQTRELKFARDEALESAKVKSEFAANVSHELRTPMNSVLGMLELLSVMGLSEQQQEYLETAKLSAENLLALIDDILSYVRSDSGSLVLENGPCNLDELLEEVTVLMATQAMKKNLDIGYLVTTPGSTVIADRQRLRQILINVIGNAIKFTETGDIAVTVELSEEGRSLLFSVADTGSGISAEWVERVFDAFTQEDATTTRKVGGTGLGLAICRQFVALMGGRIWAESQPGEGSIFFFTLPYESIDREQPLEKPRPLLEDKAVVVVDDSAIVCRFAEQWFEGQGADVHIFANFVAFIEGLNTFDSQERLIDYLFIDEDLPGVKFDSTLGFLSNQRSCKDAVVVSMVNPWKSRQGKLPSHRLLEKPLFPTKLTNFFAQGERRSELRVRERPPGGAGELDIFALVVDDNQANCLVAGGMLDHLGCEFVTAFNGQEALDYVTSKTFDLVLMDCNMPVMDGYEATAAIRRLESGKRHTPILAMTANDSVEEKERCLAAGMDDFIAKPLSIDRLALILERWAGRRHEPGTVGKAVGQVAANLDLDVIEDLKRSVGEVFGSIVDAFIEDIPIYLDALKSAIQRGDDDKVLELAHTIKGSALNFGGNDVSRLAKSLEEKGRLQSLVGADQLFVELSDAAKKMMAALAREVGHKSAGKLPDKFDGNLSRVLIADDDRSIRMVFANTLSEHGYQIAEVANGRSALALCERDMPDLIIIDAIMPEVDGFTACKKIREMPEGADVPILMVTSLEDEQSISSAFKAGATDYIPKPVNLSVLRQRVSRLLQNRRAEKHVRKLAYNDVLTGLPNRAYFNQQLRQKISRAGLNDRQLALMFLDLDRFKVINDSLGHDTGDLILKAVGERLRACVRSDDLVARLGGDEFTIVLEDIHDRDTAADISQKVLDTLTEPFIFLGQRLFVSASIGISIYPEDGADAGTLMKHADTAMFKAKDIGHGYSFYQQGMEDEVVNRLKVENELRTALLEDQIFLVYQPQFDLASGKIRGVEALVRWRHPETGTLTAGSFIPAIESSGLITELGSAVFQKACYQLESWYEQGIWLCMAVNVSGGEFQDGKLSDRIFSLLDQYHFPAHLLEVEITESMLMDQPELVQVELTRLRERGISIAVDDFGSGFSSLSYLKNFSVDLLKIDREFVKDCHHNQNDQAIISGIVALSKTLNLQTVAEGIEFEEQYEFLKSIGCDFGQGYLLGRPMSPEELQLSLISVGPG